MQCIQLLIMPLSLRAKAFATSICSKSSRSKQTAIYGLLWQKPAITVEVLILSTNCEHHGENALSRLELWVIKMLVSDIF